MGEDGLPDQEYFAMKMLTYLSELESSPKSGWKNRPVAILFSKADQCEVCLDNPTEYARKHIPGVWQLCQRFSRHEFFACGVAGQCGYRVRGIDGSLNTPLRIEPLGIEEPFQWLMQKMRK